MGLYLRLDFVEAHSRNRWAAGLERWRIHRDTFVTWRRLNWLGQKFHSVRMFAKVERDVHVCPYARGKIKGLHYDIGADSGLIQFCCPSLSNIGRSTQMSDSVI